MSLREPNKAAFDRLCQLQPQLHLLEERILLTRCRTGFLRQREKHGWWCHYRQQMDLLVGWYALESLPAELRTTKAYEEAYSYLQDLLERTLRKNGRTRKSAVPEPRLQEGFFALDHEGTLTFAELVPVEEPTSLCGSWSELEKCMQHSVKLAGLPPV